MASGILPVPAPLPPSATAFRTDCALMAVFRIVMSIHQLTENVVESV